MSFTFIDLFAGIGGFHSALTKLGGRCVLASEIDESARSVYELNWSNSLYGPFNSDITKLTNGSITRKVPVHDVLCAGFPCQPFSKGGKQNGIDDARGTLFYNIAQIIEARRPRVVILENVRNLIGPQHSDTWIRMRTILMDLDYVLPETPIIFSPHLLSPSKGGTPQIRERVFVVAVYVKGENLRKKIRLACPVSNRPVEGWDPTKWSIKKSILQDPRKIKDLDAYRLSESEIAIIDLWQQFVESVGKTVGRRLPGFPLWADEFRTTRSPLDGLPIWKQQFIRQNHAFCMENSLAIKLWLKEHSYLRHLPPTRRKLEWQAGDLPSIWSGLIQLRPSGIRVKRPNYAPSLVAMTQTSIYGPEKRRLTLREGTRLQGFDDSFDFGGQPLSYGFKQLGNAVSVGTVIHILAECSKAWTCFPQDLRLEIAKRRRVLSR